MFYLLTPPELLPEDPELLTPLPIEDFEEGELLKDELFREGVRGVDVEGVLIFLVGGVVY